MRVGRKPRSLPHGISRIATGALMFVACLASISQINAQNIDEQACSGHVRRTLRELDDLLKADPDSILAYQPALARLKQAKGCSPEDVLSIARASPFLKTISSTGQTLSHVVLMGNTRAQIYFSVRKDTGVIESPAALWKKRMP